MVNESRLQEEIKARPLSRLSVRWSFLDPKTPRLLAYCPFVASRICLHDPILKDMSLPIRELGKRKVSELSVGEVTHDDF